eukprot:scaffold596_cov236-Pinguiococcus_pyrenoidosus.AAC.23
MLGRPRWTVGAPVASAATHGAHVGEGRRKARRGRRHHGQALPRTRRREPLSSSPRFPAVTESDR